MPTWKFVARERELFQLDMALQRTITGRGSIVFVTGEAGAGKTALVTEFIRRAQAANPGLLVAPGSCKTQNVPDPYLPFREVLGLLTGDIEDSLAQGIITAENANRLQACLSTSGQALTDLGPALIDSFVSKDELFARGHESGDDNQLWLDNLQRETTAENQSDLIQEIIFEQYIAVLQTVAEQHPIVIWLDNLQWADPSSMSLLLHLGNALVGQSAILMIGSYRPEQITLQKDFTDTIDTVVKEFESFLGEVEINLDSASEIDTLAFVDALLDLMPNRLDEGFRRALFKHTGGQPLFIIELIENMQARKELVTDENGYWIAGPTLNWEVLPQKIEGLLEDRISQLDPASQEMLAVASVEGQEFTIEIVAQVSALAPEAVSEKLSSEHAQDLHLVRFRGYQRLGAQNLSLYQFRHNLTQKYLYTTLPEKERMQLHQEVGQALAELYGHRTEKIAVKLAWHYQQAGMAEKALEYLQIVADRAARIYAYTEAITFYKQAIEIAVQVQADHSVLLHLYSQLGRIMELNSQLEQALETYQEMEQLAQVRDDQSLELAAVNAQIVIHAMPSLLFDSTKGQIFAERALLLARELGDRPAESQVLWNLCKLHYTTGNYEDSITYGEKGLSIARELNLLERIAYYLNDLSRPYGLLGQTGHALTKLREATLLWRELNNQPMLTDNLSSATSLHVRRGEFEQALATSAEAWQIGVSTQNIWAQSYSQMEIGRIYWERGQVKQAITTMEKSIQLAEQSGFIVPQIVTRSDLAALYAGLGAVELGLATAQHAVDISDRSGATLLHMYAVGTLVRLQLLQGDLEAAQATVSQVGNSHTWEGLDVFNVPMQLASIELDFAQGAEETLVKTNRLLQWLEQSEMGVWLPEALFLQSKVLAAVGHDDKVLESLLAAQIAVESLQSRRLLWPILLALSQLESAPVEARYLRQQAREYVNYIVEHIHIRDLRTSFLALPAVHDLLNEETEQS